MYIFLLLRNVLGLRTWDDTKSNFSSLFYYCQNYYGQGWVLQYINGPIFLLRINFSENRKILYLEIK